MIKREESKSAKAAKCVWENDFEAEKNAGAFNSWLIFYCFNKCNLRAVQISRNGKIVLSNIGTAGGHKIADDLSALVFGEKPENPVQSKRPL
jgi:hypothetical protein